MRRLATQLVILTSLAGPAAVLRAQAPPLGAEFQVNTYTTLAEGYPAVASAGDGSFVVAWQGPDGDASGIFAQRFDPLGSRAGGELPVNSYTSGWQTQPSAAAARDGTFVVTWTSYAEGDPSGYDVFGQRFASDGSTAGEQFIVNSYTFGAQKDSSVAKTPSGDFIVVWTTNNDGSGPGIAGQRFDGSGAKLGGQFAVNTYTTEAQYRPRVASGEDGSFVVVWTSAMAPVGAFRTIRGQRFDSSGAKAGAEFQVNTYSTDGPDSSRVAIDRHGNFVVVWHNSPAIPFPPPTVAGRRFNSSGEKVGLEFGVDSYASDTLQPSVAIDRRGNFIVVWSAVDESQLGIFGERFDRGGTQLGTSFPINTYTTGYQWFPDVTSDGAGFVVTWMSDDQDGSGLGVFGRRQNFVPEKLEVDGRNAAGTSSDRNGVLEPGESVLVRPSWSHGEGTDIADLTGTLSNLSGPSGPTYAIVDAAADYGGILGNALAGCDDGTPEACYTVTVAGSRPATHWDAMVSETLSVGGGQLWRLHVGDSFSDVPRSQPFYRRIETLLHAGITLGCTPTTYCPGTAVPRDQMAIFLARALAGGAEFVPTLGNAFGVDYHCAPGGSSLFLDVAPTDPACKGVHLLAARNVTLGCSTGHYCPAATVTRDAMASFIAKAVVAPSGGAAVPTIYGPDSNTNRSYSCDAGSPNLYFTDIALSNPFCKHIHFLWAKGIADGCAATMYCPDQPVTRDAMAKFLMNAFGLELYGP